jgi:hypothetical protein
VRLGLDAAGDWRRRKHGRGAQIGLVCNQERESATFFVFLDVEEKRCTDPCPHGHYLDIT